MAADNAEGGGGPCGPPPSIWYKVKVENDLFLKGGKLRTLKSIDDNAMQYQEDCKTHKKTKRKFLLRF